MTYYAHPLDLVDDVEMPEAGWPTLTEIVAALFADGEL